jgi:hypothetical protein
LSIPKEIKTPSILSKYPWLPVYLMVLVVLLVWGVISYKLTPVENQYLTLSPGESRSWMIRLTEPWRHWDTRHYLNIAENWYTPGGPELTWPPVYPILVGLLGRILGGAYLPAALLISWSSLIAACSLLIKTYQDYTDEPTAQRAVKYLLIFPTAFFLFSGYSESLFLVLLLLSWQGAKKGTWWQAGVFGLLASMTRFNGVCLLVVYAWMWLKAPRRQKVTIAGWLAPIPLTLIGWFWLTEKFYEINPSSAVLKYWHLHTSWPWVGVINGFISVFKKSFDIYLIQDIFATFIFFAAIVWAVKKGWWSEAVFMGASLTIYLTLTFEGSNILTMTARYVLVLFPGFLLLAELGKHRWFDWTWSVISFLSMLFYATFFFVG